MSPSDAVRDAACGALCRRRRDRHRRAARKNERAGRCGQRPALGLRSGSIGRAERRFL